MHFVNFYQKQQYEQIQQELYKQINFLALKNDINLDEFHASIYQVSQDYLLKCQKLKDFIILNNPTDIPQVNQWFFVAEQDFSQRKFLQAKMGVKMTSEYNQSPNWSLFDIKSYTKQKFLIRIVKQKNKYAEQRYGINQLKKYYLVYAIENYLENSANSNSNSQQQSFQPQASTFQMKTEPKNLIDYSQSMVQNQQFLNAQRNLQYNQQPVQQQLQQNRMSSHQEVINIEDEQTILQEEPTIVDLNNKRSNQNTTIIFNQPNLQNNKINQNIPGNQNNVISQEMQISALQNNPLILNKINSSQINQNNLNNIQSLNPLNLQNYYQMAQNLNQNQNIQNDLDNRQDDDEDNDQGDEDDDKEEGDEEEEDDQNENQNNDVDNEIEEQEEDGSSQNNTKQVQISQKYSNIHNYLKDNLVALELLNSKDEKIERQKDKIKQRDELIENYVNQVKLLNDKINQQDNKCQILESQVNLLKNELEKQEFQLNPEIENEIQKLQKYKQSYYEIALKQKDIIDQKVNEIATLQEQITYLQQELTQVQTQLNQNIILNKQKDTQINQIQDLKNQFNNLQNQQQKDILKYQTKYETQNKRYTHLKKRIWLSKQQVINIQQSFKVAQKDYQQSKKKGIINKADKEIQTEHVLNVSQAQNDLINKLNDQKEDIDIKINDEAEEEESVKQSQESSQFKKEEDQKNLAANDSNKQEKEEEIIQEEEQKQSIQEQEQEQQLQIEQQEKNQQIEEKSSDKQQDLNNDNHDDDNHIEQDEKDKDQQIVQNIQNIQNLTTVIDYQNNQSQNPANLDSLNEVIDLVNQQTQIINQETNISQLTDQQILKLFPEFFIEGLSEKDQISLIRDQLYQQQQICQMQQDQQMAQELQRYSNIN